MQLLFQLANSAPVQRCDSLQAAAPSRHGILARVGTLRRSRDPLLLPEAAVSHQDCAISSSLVIRQAIRALPSSYSQGANQCSPWRGQRILKWFCPMLGHYQPLQRSLCCIISTVWVEGARKGIRAKGSPASSQQRRPSVLDGERRTALFTTLARRLLPCPAPSGSAGTLSPLSSYLCTPTPIQPMASADCIGRIGYGQRSPRPLIG